MREITFKQLLNYARRGLNRFSRKRVGSLFAKDDKGNLCGCILGSVLIGSGYDPYENGTNKLKMEGDHWKYLAKTFPKLHANSHIWYELNDHTELPLPDIISELEQRGPKEVYCRPADIK